jgi:outer membrane protein OmpA-like peptidoglycan-associated protein
MAFEVTANQREGMIEISGDDGSQISLSAQSRTGAKLPLDSDGVAILNPGGDVASSGSGFLPGSAVDLYLMTRDTCTLLGSLDVLGDGTFAGSVPLPPGLAPGTYTLQVNGLAEETRLRSRATIVRCISILVKVKEPVSKAVSKASVVRGVVYFDAYSAELTKSAKRKLNATIKQLPSKSNNLVRVVGFAAGPGGSVSHVNTLSKKRAKSVARYLKSKDIRGKYVVKSGGNASGKGSSALRAKVKIIPNKAT